MRYEILDAQGAVINTILATLEFVQEHFPGRFRAVVETPPLQSATPIPKDVIVERCTDAEWTAFTTSVDATVVRLKALFDARLEPLRPTHPRTLQMFGVLKAKGIFATQARVDAVLAPYTPD